MQKPKFNYSFDVRGKPLQQARHWSAPEIFGSRAKFNANSDPATLDIEVKKPSSKDRKSRLHSKYNFFQDIRRHDEGVYRCRVDFRTSQTQSFRYNLTVISELYNRLSRRTSTRKYQRWSIKQELKNKILSQTLLLTSYSIIVCRREKNLLYFNIVFGYSRCLKIMWLKFLLSRFALTTLETFFLPSCPEILFDKIAVSSKVSIHLNSERRTKYFHESRTKPSIAIQLYGLCTLLSFTFFFLYLYKSQSPSHVSSHQVSKKKYQIPRCFELLLLCSIQWRYVWRCFIATHPLKTSEEQKIWNRSFQGRDSCFVSTK